MNKQTRNKYVVLLIGIVIAVVSAIMAPVSANNNGLNTDCVTYANGIAIHINCKEYSVKDLVQVEHSKLEKHC